ncbi:MAG TPA: cobalamin-dependent protein [Gemmatimonadaceae bacterium]|nr:cobalamin-dependent protein [Gemmatimonadaceae bacterium]
MTSPASAPPAIAELTRRYLDAALVGNRREALRLVIEEGIERGVAVPELYLHVIQPAQFEVGRRWQANEISVAQEHVATAVSQLVVSHLYHHIDRATPNGRLVLVACAQGELHELGARLAADFLEMSGFNVVFLGANVPAGSLVRMVQQMKPDLVIISAATTLCFPGLRDMVKALREAQADLPVAIGGSAFTWAEQCAVEGVVPGGGSAGELVDVARRLTGLA